MNPLMMRALVPLSWLLALALLPGLAAAAEPGFPKPPELVPRVDFWKRIYTEVDTDHGLLHDSRDLRIVYEVAASPQNLSRRGREARIQKRRNHLKAVLQRLAGGKRTGLSADEKRVLALFPDGVTNATLREARRHIRFQRGQANKFRAGLVRQGRWEDYMLQVFRDRRLPEALTALPHVESSFNPEARSHVGASGLWQFTRSTGRRYMRVDHVVDERNDPYLATVAAARLLKANYERLGTWPLALTAYNHGASGMARAKRKLGTTDIVTILDNYKSRTFGFASRNFYTEFLAALEIQQNMETHFGPITKEPRLVPEIVVLKDFVKAQDLAKAFGVSKDELREANPALRSPIWNGQKYVPKGYGLRVPRDPMRTVGDQILASLPASQRHARQLADRTYRVRRGDSLSRIASRFGVRQSELVSLNGLRSRHRIRVGQVLKLPTRARGGSAPATVAKAEARPASGVYVMRRGDTIGAVARRYGVSQSALMAANGIRNPRRVQIGQRLTLPAAGTVVTASQTTYLIRSGDTLDAIAKRHGVSRRALQNANGIRNANRLRAGQRLVIPAR